MFALITQAIHASNTILARAELCFIAKCIPSYAGNHNRQHRSDYVIVTAMLDFFYFQIAEVSGTGN